MIRYRENKDMKAIRQNNPWFNKPILRDLFWFLYLPWNLEQWLKKSGYEQKTNNNIDIHLMM
jgi:hypothetical protein